MSIALRGITKRFGAHAAVDAVDLHIDEGELLALLGPSGSGKTTLLRILAGLEHQDTGTIDFFGTDASDVPVRRRGVGFVFQHFALFQTMSVFDNVAFGLRARPRRQRPNRRELHRRVEELLALVRLEGFAKRFPAQLSGGQRQRVALARALAVEPRVLLLDEPFGALDAKVRAELRGWVRSIHDALGVTTVLVTHDHAEALELADRVVVMNGGRIEQIDTPTALYEQPVNAFVLDFLGGVTFLDARVRAASLRLGPLALPCDAEEGTTVRVGLRAHELDVRLAAEGNATVESARPIGHQLLVDARLDGFDRVTALWRPSLGTAQPRRGDRVDVSVRRAHVFPA